jgi:hypothetical protein
MENGLRDVSGEPPPLPYDEVVERYSIEILEAPGDLVIRNGDLALSKSRDLMLNNEVYHGLYRLVQAWRFTAPSLSVLFGLFLSSRRQGKSFEADLNNLRPFAGSPFLNETQRESYHELRDKIGAAHLALQSYAGALILVLSGLLSALRDDLEAPKDEWRSAGPLVGGYSIGAIIEAAANNFRHEDEWMKTREPSERQLSSLRVLEAAFGKRFRDISGSRFSPNIAPKALELLSSGVFENINVGFFAFANDLAGRARVRLGL